MQTVYELYGKQHPAEKMEERLRKTFRISDLNDDGKLTKEGKNIFRFFI